MALLLLYIASVLQANVFDWQRWQETWTGNNNLAMSFQQHAVVQFAQKWQCIAVYLSRTASKPSRFSILILSIMFYKRRGYQQYKKQQNADCRHTQPCEWLLDCDCVVALQISRAVPWSSERASERQRITYAHLAVSPSRHAG